MDDWRRAKPSHKVRHRPEAYTRLVCEALKIAVGRIVEVGVFRGEGAERWRANFPGARLWLVDVWAKLREGGPMNRRHGDVGMNSIYLGLCRKYRDDKRTRLIRALSWEAADVFPDGHFDVVYIDADHTREAVRKDIDAWLPKVRQGGLIGGHDYERRRCHQVREVVDDIFGDDIIVGTHHCWLHLVR